MANILFISQAEGISKEVADSFTKSISKKSLQAYNGHWLKFVEWSSSEKNCDEISISSISEFLLYLFNKGYSTSSLNIARSSLNFFTLNLLKLDDSVVINKLFKYFYQIRPIKRRYSSFWSVDEVLNFLKSWYPFDSLSLKQLTLKTIALIALSSSDRGQTLHLASISNMKVLENEIQFIITDRLKGTRKIQRPKIIRCVSCPTEELNVFTHVKEYLRRTNKLRNGENKFFLSWSTRKSVTKTTLARWLKTVLSLSGINTDIFKAHSYRGAGLTKAYEKGANIAQVMAQGDWRNAKTFLQFYYAPTQNNAHEESIPNMILE